MWLISGLISSLISVVFGIILLKANVRLLKEKNFLKENFKGKKIPMTAGVIFPLSLFVSILPLLIIFEDYNYLFKFSLIILGFSFLGLLDDFMGDSKGKGFKGHIYNLIFYKKITTGFIKAFYGVILAFVVTVFYQGLYDNFFLVALNTLIIALSANAINLLDLRPGRAGKAFIIVSFISIFASNLWEYLHKIPVLIPLLIYLPGDLKSDYMLGDAGSNSLGGFLGSYIAFFYDYEFKIIILLLLVFFHVVAEFVSISEVIGKTPGLSHLDKWGRRRE